MQLFGNLFRATFISRPNRFTITCNLLGNLVEAYLPNPGRMRELLLPNSVVLIEESDNPRRMLRYTAVAVERAGVPVMLHTHKNNDVARHLIETEGIPGLEGAQIAKSEIKQGRSRFDFLLESGKNRMLLEVKSCTLFSRNVAMFPDAVTERGRRHVYELARLSNKGLTGAVLFMVHTDTVRFFLPEYHRDLLFSKALIEARDKIKILPVAVGWKKDLSLKSGVSLLEVSWGAAIRGAVDSGSYLIILRLLRPSAIPVGKLGLINFRAGFYVYVGSGQRNLSKRIERHRSMRKKAHWHIDYLRPFCEFHASLPIRTREDIECCLAEAVKEVSEAQVSGFGSTDCRCPSHLFYMSDDPLNSASFHELLQYFRMERPVKDYL